MSGVVTRTITTGAQGTRLGEGEADARFTWNYSGRYEDPRYRSYTTASGGHPDWVGKHRLANCIMGDGHCWSNTRYGPDVPPGMPAYRGVEYLYYDFDLPAAAREIRLTVVGAGADDRLVLLVNGREIGGFSSRIRQPTDGRMEDGQGRVSAHRFRSLRDAPLVLDDPSLFRPGGRNVLTFWVNNTGSLGLSAPARPHNGGDISRLAVNARLRYASAELAPTPTAIPDEPTPTARPGPSCVCERVRERAPAAVVSAAMANPAAHAGWGLRLDPSKPPGPANPLRDCLNLRHPNLGYHPLWNAVVWKVGCR